MKTIACKDSGFACDFIAKGETEEEVMSAAKEHARSAHGYEENDFTPQQEQKMRVIMKDSEQAA